MHEAAPNPIFQNRQTGQVPKVRSRRVAGFTRCRSTGSSGQAMAGEVTETEAKTKWCPMVWVQSAPAMAGVYSMGCATPDARCIASACMMWRGPRSPQGAMDVKNATSLSVRTRNSLLCYDITTLEQLWGLSEHELLRITNIGRKSVEEVRALLAGHGLTIGGGAAVHQGAGYCGLAGKP